jgi:hypothetical protein
MRPWAASQALETSQAMKNIVLTMARKQLESGRRHVNLTPIEYALFNNRGGKYHAIVKKMVDDLGLPRVSIKSRKPIGSTQHTLKSLRFEPHVITVDPQGIIDKPHP